jgi:hypothetical protein
VEYNVAFHFKSNKEKEQFQKRDNIVEYGTKTVRHEPKVIHHNLETIGFAKNIQLKENQEVVLKRNNRKRNQNNH